MPGCQSNFVGGIGEADQNRRRGTKHSDRFRIDTLEDGTRIYLSQTDVSSSGGCNSPDKSPAVSMKHWQRPKIAIPNRHGMMNEHSHRVDVGIAMSDHHAFRLCGSPAG